MLEKIFDYVYTDVKKDICDTQLKIMINANNDLVNLYYRIGKIIHDNYKWGNKFIDNLAFELKRDFPGQKGFSVRNLKYMKAFYEEYCNDNDCCLHLCAKLPWRHNIVLLQRIKNKSIRKWYMEKCITEGWSTDVLIYQIETNLYQRQVTNKKLNNFKLTLMENSDLANNMMKDPYVFDLIELSTNFKERELENKMVNKLRDILLEFGNGFSYIGNQYKITIDNQDFYIDLLFYHTELKCYIAVELKTNEFNPEYGSKMSFYLAALDEQMKRDDDNPSIGIILCQMKNKKIVDYTLKYINKPIGVSEYKILNQISDNLFYNFSLTKDEPDDDIS